MHQCPQLAQSGHGLVHCTCPIFGGKADMIFCGANSRAQHRHRRGAIRIFDRSRNKDAASIHNPNDSGAPLKWRPLPSFADQVRRETGTALREMNGVRRMSLPLSISKSKAVAMAT